MVSSANGLEVLFGRGPAAVRGLAEVMTSDEERTELLLHTPVRDMDTSKETVPVTVTPLELATEQERKDKAVSFDLEFVRPYARVVSVSPGIIPHMSEYVLLLTVEKFKVVTDARDVSVLFGGIRMPVIDIVSSDVEITELRVLTPRLSARKEGYSCSVEHSERQTSTLSAGFVLQVQDTTMMIVGVHGSMGPSTGRTKLTVELAAAAQPAAIDDIVLAFGDGLSAMYAKAEEVLRGGNSTVITFFVPPYDGPSEEGRAEVRVRLSMRQENALSTHLIYTYLTPLRVQYAVLSGDGMSLSVRFDQPANVRPVPENVLREVVGSEGASGDGSDDCSEVFSKPTLALFGEGFRCFVMSSRHIYVLLGRGASLIPGSIGALNANLRASNPLASFEVEQIPFKILGLRGREHEPSGSLVGPSQIGPCQEATIELILMSLHPPAWTEWSVSTENRDLEGTSDMLVLQERMAMESGLSITLRPEDIPVLYTDFTFQIRVVTVFGKSAVFSHLLSRTGWPIPAVQLRSSLTFSTAEPMRVEVDARASTCLDVASSEEVDAKLHYSWSISDTTGTQALDYTGTSIIHPQDSAPPRGTVSRHVGVEVFAASDPISVAKASVGLLFRPAPLVAAISGGDRAVSVEETLVLSAHAPADRDRPEVELHYRWSCTSESNSACRRADGRLLDLQMGQVMVVPEYLLLPGKVYTFHLTLTSSDGRIAAAHTQISAWSGAVESLEVTLSQDAEPLKCGLDALNAGSKVIATSTIRSLHPSAAKWALQWPEQQQEDEQMTRDFYAQGMELAALQGQTGPVISVVNAGYLRLPTSYHLIAASASGRAWCAVHINAPPHGGACSAHAAYAGDVFREIAVRCSGFLDRDAPLSYAIGVLVRGQKIFFSPSYHANQTIAVFRGISSVLVKIDDSTGSSVEVVAEVRHGGTGGINPLFDNAVINKTLDTAITEDIVQRSIVNMVLYAQNQSAHNQTYSNVSALSPDQERLLRTLIHRMRSMVQAAPPSADLGIRVMQTLLAVSRLPIPLQGLRSITTEIVLLVLKPKSLPSRVLSETELQQCAAMISNTYSQQEACDLTSRERYRFAVAMQALGEILGKGALNNVAPRDPIIEVEEAQLIVGLRKVAPGALAGAELNFPIPDGTTVSLILPTQLPPELASDAVDVHMVQHRDLWACGSESGDEVLLSFPTSLSASAANSVAGDLEFGEEEVYVTLPFDASRLSAEEIERVYRREGVSCVTWQGNDADMQDAQPWSTRGCRIESVHIALDAAGREAFGLGSVVCACSHMSTYALSFREASVRFDEPTPQHGDLLYVTAGHLLHFPVRAVGTGVSHVNLTQLISRPESQSFKDASLSPAGASSLRQQQHVAGMQVVDGNVSWTPMQAGSYVLSLGLVAGL